MAYWFRRLIAVRLDFFLPSLGRCSWSPILSGAVRGGRPLPSRGGEGRQGLLASLGTGTWPGASELLGVESDSPFSVKSLVHKKTILIRDAAGGRRRGQRWTGRGSVLFSPLPAPTSQASGVSHPDRRPRPQSSAPLPSSPCAPSAPVRSRGVSPRPLLR